MTIADFKLRTTEDFENYPNRAVISNLTPYSGLIVSVILSMLFLIKLFILEKFLIKRIYGAAYENLSMINQRGFINHHVAIGCRVILLVLAGYPFLTIIFGKSTLHTPLVKGGTVTCGDFLLIAAQLLVAMYVFELLYRVKISAISSFHHLGAILVTQSAIAIAIAGQKQAHFEFILCCVWGAFDVLVEFLPCIAIIVYRVIPNEHDILRKVFGFTAIWTFVATILETIMSMYIFGILWSEWDLGLKVSTPILHVAFSAAQLHGSNIFRKMWLREKQRLRDAEMERQQKKEVDSRSEHDGSFVCVAV